ncbi:MAG TPA: hypothetical protein VMH87_06760 [Pseudomonadales bacterium]|nr:hypothetical protein [Pseudomonadales bacterium]
MKYRPHKVILTAAAITARVTCSGQVYSQSVGSFFGEINTTNIGSVISVTNRDNSNKEYTFPSPNHYGVNVTIASESVTSATNSFHVVWIISTDVLATQPRWDGVSNDLPLEVSKAYTLILPQVHKQFPGIQKWAVQSISLCKPLPDSFPNFWCYEFIFDESTNTYPKRAFVLLDGTVVLPTVISQ